MALAMEKAVQVAGIVSQSATIRPELCPARLDPSVAPHGQVRSACFHPQSKENTRARKRRVLQPESGRMV